MRGVWIDHGQEPDWNKLIRVGATHTYQDIRDPQLNLPYLKAIRSRGYTPGVYVAPNWWPELTDGTAFAQKVSDVLQALAPGTGNLMPCVLINNEYHSAEFMRAFVLKWRELRPTRQTEWTLEPLQGGWCGPLAPLLRQAAIRILPQFYKGNMDPWSPDRVVLDLVRHGYTEPQIMGTYDGARLLEGWEGVAFTQGRIP